MQSSRFTNGIVEVVIKSLIFEWHRDLECLSTVALSNFTLVGEYLSYTVRTSQKELKVTVLSLSLTQLFHSGVGLASR